jgi:peptide/nickel transport system substrate-binding protein
MRWVRHSATVALVAVVALVLAACGGSDEDGGGGGGSSSATSLRLALADNPAPLDPDTYYEAQGTVITQAAYEGLVKYKPDSAELEGLLATSWSVSPDGRTYTFELRPDVTFSDGTPFDAQAAKASLERRTAVAGGPSYMLADVASIDAPEPLKLVVRLRRPSAPFLHYLASPFGPVMISPTAVREHAQGDDLAARWLGSHTAGTGPYELTEAQRSVRYVLRANPRYWGERPAFETVSFAIVPDVANQQLQLQGGSLDGILGGLTTRDVAALEQGGQVQVLNFPALQKAALWINPRSPVFGAPPVRAAMRAAFDNAQLTEQLYGSRAEPSRDVYPAGMLPDGAAPDVPEVDEAQLEQALASSRGEKVTIGWWADAAMRELANLVQLRLHDLGIEASVRQFSAAEILAMPTRPSLRPDLLAVALNPDAAAPDTWSRVYWHADAPVNILGCTVPEADRLLDEAVVEPNAERSDELGAQAAEVYRASNCWINIADVRDTIVLRRGVGGAEHELPWLMATRLATLRPE